MNSLLAGIFSIKDADFGNGFGWLLPIAKFLNNALIPIIIIVSILGAVWIIWIGVQLAKAEDSSKATEQKKKLINVVIALVAIIIFVFLFAFIATQLPTFLGTAGNNPFTSS